MQRVVSRRKRDDEEDDSRFVPSLSALHSLTISHRIEDRKRVLVDGDDDGDDAMMATGP